MIPALGRLRQAQTGLTYSVSIKPVMGYISENDVDDAGGKALEVVPSQLRVPHETLNFRVVALRPTLSSCCHSRASQGPLLSSGCPGTIVYVQLLDLKE